MKINDCMEYKLKVVYEFESKLWKKESKDEIVKFVELITLSIGGHFFLLLVPTKNWET